MDDPGTDALRKLAPSWTLAGDEQLLSILQNTHQRLLSKCQEANSQLEQMATALNDASISLQNVNNQFMALSSSQFIESRVYDDDDLATDVPAVKEQSKPELPDELTSLKRSITVLENAHEIITILQDSDTESDTDDEMPARMVLKPKDMYANRPLPYIIGSQPWKNKWHAGLLLEDSDSDSSASKVEHDSEQYSQSEPEDTHTDKLPAPMHTQSTVSETSSELPSDQGSVPKPTPSDVASEIARRLGAREPPKVLDRDPEVEEPPKPTVRKIYRPQDPVSSTIFPDEPPPLSEQSDSESDIFADLHRTQPYARSQPYESTRVTDDLFGGDQQDSDEGDIFSDFAKKPASHPSANPTSLFDAGPAPNMFIKHTDNRHATDHHRQHKRDDDHRQHMRDDHRQQIHDDHRQQIRDDDHRRHVYESDDRGVAYGDGGKNNEDLRARGDAEAERGVKKPIGAVSLFGNKGTESIGAAILKRNQRKSSTSGDESGSDSCSESQPTQQIRKEKDIFDDLFARSESKNVPKEKDFSKDLKTEIKKKVEVKEKKIENEKPKVDLFSDNLFDDIDDIFSTNVVKMPTKDTVKSKSIFEDDDDLFSEIAAAKPVKIEVASSSSNKKSLFDSDDELFSENKSVVPKETPKPVEITKPKVADRSKVNETSNIKRENTKSIFDDDEDELFSDIKTNEVTKVQNKPVSIETTKDLGKKDNKYIASSKTNTFKSPSLFDEDDDDDSDLFAEPAKSSNVQNVIATPIRETKISSQTDFETPTKPRSKTEVKMPAKLTSDTEVKIPAQLSSQTHEKIPTQLSSQTHEKIPTKPSILSSKSEAKIPEDSPNVKASSSVKTDESEKIVVKNEKVDLNKDSSKPVVDKLNDTPETEKCIENEDSVIPVSKNVDSKKESIESNAARIFDHIKHIEESSSDTNNDFSDQDFDDLPPKEDKNKPVINDSNIVPEKHNIFDKVTLEEDIDELFVTSQQKTDDSKIIFNPEPDFTEPITKKTEQGNKKEEILPKTIEADIFSNILTEPPVFEKPKEPKKSKNVNALFDDDSDDESLFFKKNDPIFVENPEEFTPTQDRIFGLFTDEPPDDGFTKISEEFDDEMFSTLPKPKIPAKEYPPIPDTEIFEDLTPVTNKIPEIEKVENIFSDKITEIKKSDLVEEIYSEFPKDEVKPATEKTKEPSLDIEGNIFKIPTVENVAKRQKSAAILSDDEQLFKVTEESKPALKEKPSLDFLSDDENLFASKLKSSNQEIPLPKNITSNETKSALKNKPSLDVLFAEIKKPTLQVKPSLDISDDENLFASKSALEKHTSLTEKPVQVNKNLSSTEKSSLDLLSDDENLFFSKKPPKLEKPTSLPKKVEKPENKNLTFKDKLSPDFLSDDENLFTSEKLTSSKQEKAVLENKNLESPSKSSDDEIISSLEKTENPITNISRLLQQDSKSDEDLFKKSEFIPKTSESKPEKKVGKLKVGLNINVNALLPGASPKKVKAKDQPDGQSQSVSDSQKAEPKTQSEVRKSEPEIPSHNTDSKLLKSVSFDGKPESDVLDNKLSKERARIQVKRRPSTRRARKEAVRKSGIDFGEDSTDNSSSIDDPPRRQREVSKEDAKENIPNIPTDRLPNLDAPAKLDDTTAQTEIDSNIVEKQPKIEPEKHVEVEKPSYSRDVKSKVVYILTDEDIFNTSPVENINKNITKNLDSNPGVSTLGKVYNKNTENTSKKDSKSSLFGEENDEEIFKPKTVKKSIIFDSDSEEDLFGTTSKKEERKVEKIEVKREIKREMVKGSLFGDEDADDDLFGVKTKKIVDQKPQPSRTTVKETPKPAEPVFEDPLSMFGDD